MLRECRDTTFVPSRLNDPILVVTCFARHSAPFEASPGFPGVWHWMPLFKSNQNQSIYQKQALGRQPRQPAFSWHCCNPQQIVRASPDLQVLAPSQTSRAESCSLGSRIRSRTPYMTSPPDGPELPTLCPDLPAMCPSGAPTSGSSSARVCPHVAADLELIGGRRRPVPKTATLRTQMSHDATQARDWPA